MQQAMKAIALVIAFLSLAVSAQAACPPPPVGKPSDSVVQFVTSGTAGFGPTSALDATRTGSVVFDSSASTLKFCDGTAWVAVSMGVPSGAVWAFDLTSCPAGWSEYTAARGRFLRGIDNGAGNDPDGTRAPGNAQDDAFQGHWHNAHTGNGGGGHSDRFNRAANDNGSTTSTAVKGPTNDGVNGTPRISDETRPKNVAVLFCRKT